MRLVNVGAGGECRSREGGHVPTGRVHAGGCVDRWGPYPVGVHAGGARRARAGGVAHWGRELGRPRSSPKRVVPPLPPPPPPLRSLPVSRTLQVVALRATHQRREQWQTPPLPVRPPVLGVRTHPEGC